MLPSSDSQKSARPDQLTRFALAGANGHMGQAIQHAAAATTGFDYVGALEETEPRADEVLARNRTLLESVDVVIDFTNALDSVALAEACAVIQKAALVTGSTGQCSDLLARIEVASSRVPIVRSGNFSFAFNVMLGLIQKASSLFLPVGGTFLCMIHTKNPVTTDHPGRR